MSRCTILGLSILVFLSSCVPLYQNYLKGIYMGSSTEVFPILDQIVKGEGFSLLSSKENEKEDSLIVEYDRYDNTIRKRISASIYLRGVKKDNTNTEVLITITIPGWKKEGISSVDRDFESLVAELKSRLGESRFKIIKKS